MLAAEFVFAQTVRMAQLETFNQPNNQMTEWDHSKDDGRSNITRILSNEMVVQDRPLLAVNGVLILTNGSKYMAFTGGFHPPSRRMVPSSSGRRTSV